VEGFAKSDGAPRPATKTPLKSLRENFVGIILGLTGALCWGAADFAARFGSRRVGAYRTLFFMQLFGFLALTIYLESQGGIARGVAPGWHPWALAVAAGLMNVTASLALYHSFEVGVMSIVAPVSSAYPALTVALSLLSGERIHPIRAAGLAVTLIGVVLASTSFAKASGAASPDREESQSKFTEDKATARPHLSEGVGWAIVAGVLFGFLFWFLGYYVVPVVGGTVSVWIIRLTSFSALLLCAAPARQSLRIPRGNVWWLLAAVGVMDTAAFIANNAGLHTGQVAVVSVLASLYGAVTVLLSWIFLRERLEPSQWFGIALIFAGIVLVSL
jgi:drug/metabolite transporter (DMT)-like permease